MSTKITVAAMIRIYCKRFHGAEGLCQDCSQLLEYCCLKLDRCVYGDRKPACAKCSIHCYNPSRRLQIKRIMRYSGPMMICRHPFLAIRHLISKIKLV